MLADRTSRSGPDRGDAVDSRADDGGNVLGAWNRLGARVRRDRKKWVARIRRTPGLRHVVGLLLLDEIVVARATAFRADVIGTVRKHEIAHRFDVATLSEREP